MRVIRFTYMCTRIQEALLVTLPCSRALIGEIWRRLRRRSNVTTLCHCVL